VGEWLNEATLRHSPPRRTTPLRGPELKSRPPNHVQTSGNAADTEQMAKKKAKAHDTNSATKTKAPRLYRDATTGRFVTKKFAKKNPKKTVKERRYVSPNGDGPGSV
jgi:hypothetical protein